MRKSEFGKGEMQVVVVKDIEIDCAWRVECMILGSSKDLLDALQRGEQVKRRKGAGDFDGGIEEQRRTGRAIHWIGLKDAGAQERPTILMENLQMQSGGLQEVKALVQIRSERDANPHFKPRTSCMS
jgi:hypothetical protein